MLSVAAEEPQGNPGGRRLSAPDHPPATFFANRRASRSRSCAARPPRPSPRAVRHRARSPPPSCRPAPGRARRDRPCRAGPATPEGRSAPPPGRPASGPAPGIPPRDPDPRPRRARPASGAPGGPARARHAARSSATRRRKSHAWMPSPVSIATRVQRGHQRAIASNPTRCSGSVPSLSLRIARTPKETAGALALAAGVSRHPTL